MNNRILFFLAGLPLLLATVARAQVNSFNISVVAQATIQENPPKVTLSWLADDSALSYSVARYDPTTDYWKQKANVGKALTWSDTNVVPGVAYEYQITKQARLYTGINPGYGYVYTGINVPGNDFSGTVILMVDDTFATNLTSELNRLVSDLAADGWRTIRHNVKRSATPVSVKNLIVNDMRQDPTIRSLFLFGHVPVPYSGFMNPDGHGDHFGAWPADVYYGDTTMEWTDDEDGLNTINSRAPNVNRAGDGKFDQSQVDQGYVELEVGRVDFWQMPSFATSEKELLRQYLNKDHAFRVGTLTAPHRALMTDNFGAYGEGFACDGWRTFGNLVGPANIFNRDWFSTLDTAAYLWAYGCGGGTPTSCGGVGSTSNFASTDTKAIFTILFGSYFGDWNVPDNFLRAPLTSSSTLSCFWGGRPHWYVHHMAMGQTIGYSAKLTQNTFVGGLYNELNYQNPIVQGVHIALLGDPTLRMSYEYPPSNFVSISGVASGAQVVINWSTATAADGFYVYRAHHWNDPYSKLTTIPTAARTFTDSTPYFDSNYYVVRAIARAGSSHGSYFTVGQASNAVVVTNISNLSVIDIQRSASSITVAMDGPLLTLRVPYKSGNASRLSLFDISGREVKLIDPAIRGIGVHEYVLDLRQESSFTSGVYFVRILGSDPSSIAKFVIAR